MWWNKNTLGKYTVSRIFLWVVLAAGVIPLSNGIVASITQSSTEKKVFLQAYLFEGEPKQKIAQWVLPGDKEFSMSFFHSVTHTPISSTYTIQDNTIIQIKERFITHGYGLPSQTNDIGFQKWEQKDGVFIIHMNRDVNPLIVRVSTKYKTTLTIDTLSYSLQKYDGRSLLFKVVKI